MTAELSMACDPCQDEGYRALKEFIIQATGLVYYADKDDYLGYRISRRLAETHQAGCSAYLELLREPGRGDIELDRIVEELTVGETSFFRHAELFDALQRLVIPNLLQRNREKRRLRIWSAGCSIGAEAYSLAILLSRGFSREIDGWDVSIVGTDINRKFLARAAAGVFGDWDFRGVDISQIESCFLRRGGDWIIRPEYRRAVTFQYHNLVRHPFPSPLQNLVAFDLVLCRNVLMYFGMERMRGLVNQFHDCIASGGWLLVGHAEPSIEVFRAFRTVNAPGAVLYQKYEEQERRVAAAPKSPGCVSATAIAPSSAPRRSAAARGSESPTPVSALAPMVRSGPAAMDDAAVKRLADSGDLERALRECECQTARQPMNASLHLQSAILAEQLGQSEQAATSLRKSIYLDPHQALAHYFLGLFEQKHARPHEAMQAYERVLDLLAPQSGDDRVPGGDGLTVRDLRELARMQQEVMGAS